MHSIQQIYLCADAGGSGHAWSWLLKHHAWLQYKYARWILALNKVWSHMTLRQGFVNLVILWYICTRIWEKNSKTKRVLKSAIFSERLFAWTVAWKHWQFFLCGQEHRFGQENQKLFVAFCANFAWTENRQWEGDFVSYWNEMWRLLDVRKTVITTVILDCFK